MVTKLNGVEKLLSVFECNAEPVFDRIIRENRIPLDSQEWDHACAFIALLDQRLPIAREALKQSADWMMNLVAESTLGTKERLADSLKHIEANTGQKLEFDLESARRLIEEGGVSASVPQNWYIQMMLELSARLAPLIGQMTPHLLVSGDAEFITGDCPLAKRDRKPSGFFGLGWALKTVEVGLPLGRNHCIVLTWDPVPRVMHADRDAVANVNCQIAQWAMRYVLGPRDNFVWMDRDESVKSRAKLLFAKMSAAKINRQLIRTWPPRPKRATERVSAQSGSQSRTLRRRRRRKK